MQFALKVNFTQTKCYNKRAKSYIGIKNDKKGV